MVKCVKIRLEIGKPKRRSGAYIKHLLWDPRNVTRRRDEGEVINFKNFHEFQIEEGPDIFDGLKFKLIPCENRHNP